MKATLTRKLWVPGTLQGKLILQQWQWREAGDPLLSGWLSPAGSAEEQSLDTKTYKCPSLLSGLQISVRIPRGANLRRHKALPEIPPAGADSHQTVPAAPGHKWLLGAEGRGKVRPIRDLGWNPLKFTNLILSWFLFEAGGSRHFLFYPNQLSHLQREDKGAAVIFPKPSTKSMSLLCTAPRPLKCQ